MMRDVHRQQLNNDIPTDEPAAWPFVVMLVVILAFIMSMAGPAFDEATSHLTPRDNPTIAPDPPQHPDIIED